MVLQRIISLAIAAALTFVGAVALAADPTFVGALSLAVQDDVAKELGLSEDTKGKLLALIDTRENEVLKAGFDKLPDDERKGKLAAFAAESEKQGLALLTKEQQAKLMQLRVARGGLSTLEEASVAEAVGLSDVQQRNVQKLLGGLKEKLAAGTEAERRAAKAEAERELNKILTKDQRVAWDKLAGLVGADAGEPPVDEKPKPETEKPAEAADDKPVKPETKPGTTRPGDKELVKPVATKAQPPKKLEDIKLRINFSYTPWKDVLEWLAKEADLSVVGDTMPSGTCNYRDTRLYTVPQAIDIMNGILRTRGYTLLRKDRMLVVWALEDGAVLTDLVPLVTPEELDQRGDYEVLTCIFPFGKLTAEEVESDIRKLMGAGGSMQVLAKTKHVSVTETGAKLRAIRQIIKDAEDPIHSVGKAQVFKLKHRTTEEMLPSIRQLMGIPEGLTSLPDGSLRISVEAGKFIVMGKAEQVERFKEIVDLLESDEDPGVEVAAPEQPQIVVYPITTADPDAALAVLRTILANQLNVRIDKDPATGSLIAHATPTQHATIRALIDEMQKDPREIAVIKLKKVDPEIAKIAIDKLFGIVEGAPAGSKPVVVADTTLMQLQIRASKAQVEQIKDLLAQMGEVSTPIDPTTTERSYMRPITIAGRARSNVLTQLETMLPLYMSNPVRVVPLTANGPSDEIPSRIPVHRDLEKRMTRPSTSSSKPTESRDDRGDDRDGDRESRYDRYDRSRYGRRFDDDRRGEDDRPRGEDRPRGDDERRRDEERRSSRSLPRNWQYVAWQDPEAAEKPSSKPEPSGEKVENDESEPAAPAEAPAPVKQKSIPGAEIVITVTPTGFVVASQDLDALDKIEEYLATIVPDAGSTKEYTIFYLKFAKADIAAELLQQALGGGGGGGDDGGGSLMGDIAGSMFGGGGGGGGMGSLMGSLLGGGGSGGGSSAISAGPVLLIPDNRLNAILAQGKPADLDLAEILLKIIDQQKSQTDVETTAKPRFIPVYHTTADEMATTIKQVYANRMAADPSQPRQPTPQDLVAALRGGRGGGRGGAGGGNDRKSEEQKMTIGVDLKSNSLIVSAPPALFDEVAQMVKDLDIASTQKDEVITMVKSGTNPLLIENSLTSILGDSVKITRMGSSSSTTAARPQTRNTNNANRPGQPQGPNAQPNPQQAQADFMRALQGAQGGGQRGGRGGGGQGGGGNRGGR